MSEADRPNEQLVAELQELRLLRGEQERTIHALHARQAAFDTLCGYVLDQVFFVDAAPHDQLRFSTEISNGRRVSSEGWPAFLSEALLKEKSRHVFRTGQKIEYEDVQHTSRGRQAWRVLLLPIAGAAGRVESLIGSARNVTAEHRTQAALQETTSLYHRLLDLLPDPVVFSDVLGQLLYVNSAGLKLMGATDAEELTGRSIWEMVHPEDRTWVRARFQRLRDGEQVDLVEQRLVRLDGQVVAVEASSVPVQYHGRPAALSTIRDLSERKRMEAALSQFQERFYKAFQLGPAAFSISRLADGMILEVNEQYLKLTGFSREELIGASGEDLNLFVDPEAWRALLGEFEGKGVLHEVELRIRRKDGEIRTLLLSAQRIEVDREACLLAIMLDITDRKRAAASERESRSLLSKIFHASPAAITITRFPDGYVIDVNEAWCRLMGYTQEEVKRHTVPELDLWVEPERRMQFVQRVHEEGFVREYEMVLRTKRGEVRTVLCSAQQIRVKDKPCLLTVISDITERKLAETELLKAKEQAEELARIKTAFLTNMTHEVRTPLTVILGFTSMLRQGVRKEYQRFVRVIERSGRRLLLMLDSILDLAQLEAGTLEVRHEPFNIVHVLQNVATELRPLAEEKGLAFELDIPQPYVPASIDHKIVTRVLNNLLDNAIKFTEEGCIRLGVEAGEDHVCVRISDTGIGIDQTFLPHIFKEFSQESTGLERTHQGSGLGLTVSKRLVELVGGSIHVESRKGEGSLFTVKFPRSRPSNPSA